MRVLVLLPADLLGGQIGGIQTFVRDFVRFCPPDFEIEVVGATSDPQARPLLRWQPLKLGDREVRYLPLIKAGTGNGRARVPLALRFTVSLLRHRRLIDTTGRNLQFHRPGTPLAFLRHSGPMIQVVHLDPQAGVNATRWRWLPGLFRRVEALTLARMARVYLPRRESVAFYQRRYPARADHFRFLPGWYDDELFGAASAGEREALRRELLNELGLETTSSDVRLVLFVGRLEAVKDPRLLIESFGLMARGEVGRTAHLLVVGDGQLQPAAGRWAAESGIAERIHFLGALGHARVARLMKAGDALVLTSRSEGGGPRVVLEALASGLPVVAPAVGEVSSLVGSGRNGRVLAERKAEAFAEAVEWVLSQPRQQLLEAARVSAAPFAASSVLAELYGTHRALAESSGAG